MNAHSWWKYAFFAVIGQKIEFYIKDARTYDQSSNFI